MKRAVLQVHLIASTQVHHEAMRLSSAWTPPEDYTSDAEWLIEFAGRACYQSWRRPNPTTSTNRGYINNIVVEQGHFSVIEHGTATFYWQGVSRSLTHELVRHRHFSYSQLSQRFVDSKAAAYVLPPALEGLSDGIEGIEAFMEAAQYLYVTLAEGLERDLADVDPRVRRKKVREAARSILPNATETKIVVTGNLRAWRHFLSMRGSEHADAEIRHLAVQTAVRLKGEFPSVFADFYIRDHPDGFQVVETLTEGH